jgi:hypothetical protein
METDRQIPGVSELGHALRVAWIIWLALLLVTLALLLITIVVAHNATPTEAQAATARKWLWVIVAYYLVVVVGAFFRTDWLFRGYYRSRPVAPRTYVAGMTTVWIALAVGAWVSLAVCAFTRTLLPNLLFAGVGNVMLLALWPRGNAMAPAVKNPDDPEQYEEPR